MKKMKIFTILALVGVAFATFSMADSDEYSKKSYKKYGSKYSVAPVNNKLYEDECASCHFGYQPGLLPKRSWVKLMEPRELENHFGDDATLEEEDRLTLLGYLTANAADSKYNNSRLSKEIAREIPRGLTPIALSQTRYFKHDHDEIPKRFIEQKEVKSIANCAACHTTAQKGYYGERDIVIPNYGRWDD